MLLAGDAAHVHSPFGGQGLNLGIGDAVNLGWKLAATVRGWAPEGLLDTYTTERHPIGAWVLDWTRAQVALMRPDPHASALREVVTDLTRTVTGTDLLRQEDLRVSAALRPQRRPPAGRRQRPGPRLADGTRLADHLHEGRAPLLDLSGELRALAGGYGDRIKVITTAVLDETGPAGLLVRPDGFVAWAADTADTTDAELGSLEAALSTWLGAPAVATPA